MASSDPKKLRSFEDAFDREALEAEEDPLIELARIVSEDSGFSHQRREDRAPLLDEPLEGDAMPVDLEAELLQELETTFTARPAPAAASPNSRPASNPAASHTIAPPAPSPASPLAPPLEPPPAGPVDVLSDADDLLRSIEEQLGHFEQRTRTGRSDHDGTEPTEAQWSEDANEAHMTAPTNGTAPRGGRVERAASAARMDESIEDALRAEWEAFEERSVDARTEYRFRGPAAASTHRKAADREGVVSNPRQRPEPVEGRTAGSDRARERAPSTRSTAAGPEVSGLEPRGFDGGALGNGAQDVRPAAADIRQHRRGRLSVVDDARETTRSAVVAEVARERAPETEDLPNMAQWQGRAAAEVDEPRVAAAGGAPPAVGRGTMRVNRRRSGRGALIAAALIVVMAGAVGALYLRSAEQTADELPPVIAAQEGPVKIAAEEAESAAAEETVGDAVYDRVAGNPPRTAEQVVESAEEPREIARIVLPPSQAEADSALVRPVGEAGAQASADTEQPAADGEDEIGPRRVQTYVVRPDGSVVATSEVPSAASDSGLAEQQMTMTSETEAMEPDPVPTVTIGAPADGSRNALRGSSSDVAGMASGMSAATPPPQQAVADGDAGSTVPSAVAAIEPSQAPPPAATQVESDSTSAADLLTNPPAQVAALPVQPSGAEQGGYLVQVSSQRSMDQAEASFADMRRRFGGVLGDLSPKIQKADLGEQGIYYRVRVGPWATREEAVGVCEALQAAGGSCYVTR